MDWARHAGPQLIAIGNLKQEKDFPLLLEAFAKVRQQVNARLLILGEGQERNRLEGRRAKLGLDAFVDMPGFVANPYAYLARADLFLLSSASEGFGNVVVEALACGTPIVSTDCSGPREILADGRHGRLVAVGDPHEFASAILAALEVEHDRAALIRRSQDFSVKKAADAYLELLFPASSE
jgi:glycosyltransferase involved in cell wall biosynthesis